jgi:entericidin B
MTKKFMLMVIAMTLVTPTIVLTGCNTVQGAGADIQAGGKALKEEAQEHKHY